MMLFKNKSAKTYKLFYLSLIPFLLIVAGSTLVFNTSKARTLVSTGEEQIHDVALHLHKDILVEQLAPGLAADQVEVSTQEDNFLSESLVFAEQDTSKKGGSISKYRLSRSHVDQAGNELFTSVEINPAPKMGMDAFRRWIAENYKYPLAAIDAGVKGTITVSFIVETDGRLSDIKVLKDDIGHGTAEAAVKLMEKAEKWNPGIQNGRAVRTAYTLPIRLDLTQM